MGLVLEALQVLAEGGLVDLEQRCELRDANRRVQLAAAVAESEEGEGWGGGNDRVRIYMYNVLYVHVHRTQKIHRTSYKYIIVHVHMYDVVYLVPLL